ncbi:HPF/RaiA family ribosome-associated protein, partial [Acinetobacter baumannii]|uniref:HPF/RaiA family ribosome-associated protein n=1 Tax=Acinetobacter baumannii TaxID=470 RepID=UPI0031F4325B
MEVRVAGHQVDTGAALQNHVTERLQALTERYFSRATAANVTFGKGPHDIGFTCDIVAPVVNGVVLK